MRGVVVEFGGALASAVVGMLQLSLGSDSGRIWVLPFADQENLNYEPFEDSFEGVLLGVARGQYSSVQLQCNRGSVGMAAIYCPHFAGSPLAEWSGSLEGERRYCRELFQRGQAVVGLDFVALFAEESPAFEMDWVTEETFPWADWRLISGAVRQSDGGWYVVHRQREVD